ncbi:transposase [Kurthia sibirica]
MNHLKWFDWAKNSNGFLEGINNKMKVMKRHAYGYKRFERRSY